MKEQLQMRLETLRNEFGKGQIELQKVEKQRTYLNETILRIDGAIQVLEELLEGEPPEGNGEVNPSERQSTIAPKGERVG